MRVRSKRISIWMLWIGSSGCRDGSLGSGTQSLLQIVLHRDGNPDATHSESANQPASTTEGASSPQRLGKPPYHRAKIFRLWFFATFGQKILSRALTRTARMSRVRGLP